MTDENPQDILHEGHSDPDAARNDPRWERYLEFCAALKSRGQPCPAFADWIVQSEESY